MTDGSFPASSPAPSAGGRATAWALRLAREPRVFLPASFAWGFAEATLFFVIPDVLIGWVALHDLKKGLAASLAACAGALAGGLLVFLFPHAFLPLFPAIPGIGERMIARVGEQVAERGAPSMLTGPLQGIPYKLYAAQLGASGGSLAAFALLTPPARLARFVLVALLLAGVGRVLRRLRDARPDLALAVYAAGWTLQYVAYFVIVWRTYGSL